MPSRSMVVSSVEAIFSPMSPPPWQVVQKNSPPAGQAGSCRGLTNRSPCTNMNRAPQTCSMSAEPNKSLRKTSLPAHRYLESTARSAALVGAWHTSSHIRGISVSVATPQINRRCSNFSGDRTCAKGAGVAKEGEAAVAAAAAYP